MESYLDGLDRRDFVPAPGLQRAACQFFAECRGWSWGREGLKKWSGLAPWPRGCGVGCFAFTLGRSCSCARRAVDGQNADGRRGL